MFENIARWWLLDGAKYAWSRWRAGYNWNMHIQEALTIKGQTLNGCQDMHDVVRVFLGKYFWKPDGGWQLDDVVLSTIDGLNRGGDDCDFWGMVHAQAMEYVLGPKGWKSQIVSYYADPWWVSHHYCVLTEPNGKVWVVQPQPTEENWAKYGHNNQVVFGPYNSIHETVYVVASWYNAKPVFWDIRNSKYEK